MVDPRREWLAFLAYHGVELEADLQCVAGYAHVILKHVQTPSEWYSETGEEIRRKKKLLSVGDRERRGWFDFLAAHDQLTFDEFRNFSFGFREVADEFLSKITPLVQKRPEARSRLH